MRTPQTRVFVYWDSTRRCWSLRSLATGRVLNYRNGRKVRRQRLALRDCTFAVSEAGRQRTLATGVKTRHAGVIGTLTQLPQGSCLPTQVRYRPFERGEFFTDTGAAVTRAPLALFDRGRVFI